VLRRSNAISLESYRCKWHGIFCVSCCSKYILKYAGKRRTAMSKKTKECILQCRCTEEEKRYIDKIAKNHRISRSEYIRELIFKKNHKDFSKSEFVVVAQEIINCMGKYHLQEDEKLKRMVEKLWKLL
jgi:hypothetical protein